MDPGGGNGKRAPMSLAEKWRGFAPWNNKKKTKRDNKWI
jgi:hypothetical protein